MAAGTIIYSFVVGSFTAIISESDVRDGILAAKLSTLEHYANKTFLPDFTKTRIEAHIISELHDGNTINE